MSRLRETIHNPRLSILTVIAFIIDFTMKMSALEITKHYLIIGVGAALALSWINIRLFVIAPAFALGNFRVTARRAFDATAGRICELIFIDICVVMPFAFIIVMLGLAALLAQLGLKSLSIPLNLPKSPMIPILICAALLSTVGLSLRSALEAEVFRRLFLAPAIGDKNENFPDLS